MATIGAAPATQWQDEQLAAAPKTAKGHNFGASDGAGRLRRGASAAAPTDPRSSSSGCPAALRHLTPTDHEQLMPLRSPSGFSSRGRRRHAARHARRRPPALALPIQRALLRAAPNRMQPPPRPRVGARGCGARGGGRLWRPFRPRDVGVCGRACRPRRLATKDGPWLGRSPGGFARKPCT